MTDSNPLSQLAAPRSSDPHDRRAATAVAVHRLPHPRLPIEITAVAYPPPIDRR